MENWIWILLVERIISSTCPFTSKIGSALNLITSIAVPIFCLLCFFISTHWWYGLIAFGEYLIIPLLTLRVSRNTTNLYLRIYSGIFSHLNILVVILMYLSLFRII